MINKTIDIRAITTSDPQLTQQVKEHLTSYDWYSSTQCLDKGDGFFSATEEAALLKGNFEKKFPTLWLDFKNGLVREKQERKQEKTTSADRKQESTVSEDYLKAVCSVYDEAEQNGNNPQNAWTRKIHQDIRLATMLDGSPLLAGIVGLVHPLPPTPKPGAKIHFSTDDCQ